jgi:hypothetical protein
MARFDIVDQNSYETVDSFKSIYSAMHECDRMQANGADVCVCNGAGDYVYG